MNGLFLVLLLFMEDMHVLRICMFLKQYKGKQAAVKLYFRDFQQL